MNLDVLDGDNIKHRLLLAAVATSVFISSKMKTFILNFLDIQNKQPDNKLK